MKVFYQTELLFNTYAPNDPNLVEKLTSKGVSITASPLEDKMPSLLGILLVMVSNAFTYWSVDIFYETNARWKRWSYGFWKI